MQKLINRKKRLLRKINKLKNKKDITNDELYELNFTYNQLAYLLDEIEYFKNGL